MSFVPVPDNWKPYYRDPSTKKDKSFAIMGSMRLGRDRKERRFVSRAVAYEIDEPHAGIVWTRPLDSDRWTNDDYDSAGNLARLVGYLGHSSSVVAMDVGGEFSASALVPDNDGTLLLRVPYQGRLAELEAAFQAGRRPPMSLWQPYGLPQKQESGPKPPWRDMVVFRLVGGPHRLPLVASLRATRKTRETLKEIFRQPPFNQEAPEVVSGRASSTSGVAAAMTNAPHLSYVPLPDVGHLHASGALLGLALLLPESLKGQERRTVLQAIQKLHALDLGQIGCWRLERQTLEAPLHGLLPDTWSRPSRLWATVTPISFDRDPGDLHGDEAQAGVTLACERLGLPAPAEVELSATPFVEGAEHAREFGLFQAAPTAPRRRHVHARLKFDLLVSGPLVIGAGRYLGYGLCRPIAGGTP